MNSYIVVLNTALVMYMYMYTCKKEGPKNNIIMVMKGGEFNHEKLRGLVCLSGDSLIRGQQSWRDNKHMWRYSADSSTQSWVNRASISHNQSSTQWENVCTRACSAGVFEVHTYASISGVLHVLYRNVLYSWTPDVSECTWCEPFLRYRCILKS